MTIRSRLQQLERLIRPSGWLDVQEIIEVRKGNEDEPEEIEVPYLKLTQFESDGTPIASVHLPKNGRDDHITAETNIGGPSIS